MIAVEGLRKTYRTLTAVDGVSFAVDPGEVVGLVGPNGAGKTTTLRALCGIIPPTAGRVAIGGHDIARDAVAAKQQLAFIPDDPNLFEALTVWEHLMFVAKTYGVHDWKPEAERLLARFDLLEKRGTIAQELSRGMRQKLAICCAYLHAPKALLFDEPLTGLDPRAIRIAKDSVREQAQAGAAIIISSHLLDLVEDLCSHLLILHHGRQLYVGPIEGARDAFAREAEAVSDRASLEDVFLRATEDPPPPPG